MIDSKNLFIGLALSLSQLPAQAAITVQQQSNAINLSGTFGSTGIGVVQLIAFDPRLGVLNSYGFAVQYTYVEGFSAGVWPGPGMAFQIDTMLTLRQSTEFGRPDYRYRDFGRGATCYGGPTCGPTSYTMPPVNFTVPTAAVGSGVPPNFYGGSVGMSFRTALANNVSGATGTWSLTNILARGSQIYEAKSATAYVSDAVFFNQVGGDRSSARAQAGYSDIIGLRQTSSETSRGNLALRDAEYYLRGYSGGALFREVSQGAPINLNPGNDPWAAVFINLIYDGSAVVGGVSAYNRVKEALAAMGRNIGGSNSLPATPVGGEEANSIGFTNGLQSSPIVLLPSGGNGRLRRMMGQGANPASNLVPSFSAQVLGPEVAAYASDVSFFKFDVTGVQLNTAVRLALGMADFASISVSGNRLKGLSLEGSAQASVQVSFMDQVLNLAPGSFIDFGIFSADGIASFDLATAYGAARLDLTALGFSFAGNTNAAINVSTAVLAVPEAATAHMLLAGLILALSAKRFSRTPSIVSALPDSKRAA